MEMPPTDRPTDPLPCPQQQQVQAQIFPYYFSISFVLILASLGAWAHLEVGACGVCVCVWLFAGPHSALTTCV
jgi:hypothetical protein